MKSWIIAMVDRDLRKIYNGNRTEWSTIRSVIIRVIGFPRNESPIC